jgi:hypothetical protein
MLISDAMNGKDSALLHICFKARGLTKELQDIQCESDVTDRGMEKDKPDFIVTQRKDRRIYLFLHVLFTSQFSLLFKFAITKQHSLDPYIFLGANEIEN